MRLLAVVAAVTFGLAACSDGGGSGADPTVPTSGSTSSTVSRVEGLDVSVVPERIDEAYLNAVLAALDAVDGEATRIIVRTKRFPPEAADLLNAIYSDEALESEAEVWFEAIGRDPELGGLKPDPGRRITTVERIISATPACVWMAVKRDYSQTDLDPGPHRTEYVALHPLDRTNDPGGRNPTPWMITTDGFRSDGSEPANPCEG